MRPEGMISKTVTCFSFFFEMKLGLTDRRDGVVLKAVDVNAEFRNIHLDPRSAQRVSFRSQLHVLAFFPGIEVRPTELFFEIEVGPSEHPESIIFKTVERFGPFLRYELTHGAPRMHHFADGYTIWHIVAK